MYKHIDNIINIYIHRIKPVGIATWRRWSDVGVRGICNHYKGKK